MWRHSKSPWDSLRPLTSILLILLSLHVTFIFPLIPSVPPSSPRSPLLSDILYHNIFCPASDVLSARTRLSRCRRPKKILLGFRITQPRRQTLVADIIVSAVTERQHTVQFFLAEVVQSRVFQQYNATAIRYCTIRGPICFVVTLYSFYRIDVNLCILIFL